MLINNSKDIKCPICRGLSYCRAKVKKTKFEVYKCCDCGHGFIWPKLTSDKQLLEIYNDDYAVDYNPNTRYNAKQAADEYKKLLPIFKEHLKQNEIRKGLAGLEILNEENDLPMIPTPMKEPTPKVKEPTPKEPTKRIEEEWKNDNNDLANKMAKLNIKRKTRKLKNLNMSIIPSTGEDLKRIYYASEKNPTNESELVKIARALGSRVNFIGKTKLAIVNDIIHKASKRDLDLRFVFKK